MLERRGKWGSCLQLGRQAHTRSGQGHSSGAGRRLWELKQLSMTSVESGKTAWRRQPWLVLVHGQEKT